MSEAAPPLFRDWRTTLFGWLGAAMVAGGIFVLLFGGPADGAEAVLQAPELVIDAPASGDTIRGPVALEFQLSAPLTAGPAGWQWRDLHLHAEVDGASLMPRTTDIARTEGGYRWTLPALPPGSRRLRLGWAGDDHRPLAAGVTPEIIVFVAPE